MKIAHHSQHNIKLCTDKTCRIWKCVLDEGILDSHTDRKPEEYTVDVKIMYKGRCFR